MGGKCGLYSHLPLIFCPNEEIFTIRHKMTLLDFEISILMRTFALIGKIVIFNAYP